MTRPHQNLDWKTRKKMEPRSSAKVSLKAVVRFFFVLEVKEY